VHVNSYDQGEGREGVETAIHRASPSVMRASRGVIRSNCKQIWLRVHDPSEGMLKLLLYKLEVTNARKLLPHCQNFGLGCSKSGYNPWIIQSGNITILYNET
jgi:hypothetical protein